MHLTASSALVTGSASGIGAAIARRLASQGARVVIADLDAEQGEAVAAELGGVFVQVDVTSSEQIQAAVDAAVAVAPLRVAVASAGIGWGEPTLGRDGAGHTLDAFRRVLQVNLIGTFDLVRLAATAMSRNEPGPSGERGAILNVASIAAFDGSAGLAAYSASKGGVVAMTLPVARDLAAVGIRVNAIAPGHVDTQIFGSGERADSVRTMLGERVLVPKRLGEPDEVAAIAVEVLGNRYVNGEVVRVDGGIRMPPA